MVDSMMSRTSRVNLVGLQLFGRGEIEACDCNASTNAILFVDIQLLDGVYVQQQHF